MKTIRFMWVLFICLSNAAWAGVWFDALYVDTRNGEQHYPVTVFIQDKKLKIDVTRIAGENASLLYDDLSGTLYFVRYRRSDFLYWDVHMIKNTQRTVQTALNMMERFLTQENPGTETKSDMLLSLGEIRVNNVDCMRYEWVVDGARKQVLDVTTNVAAEVTDTLLDALVFGQQLSSVPGLDLLGFYPPDIQSQALQRIKAFPVQVFCYRNDEVIGIITAGMPQPMKMRKAMFVVPANFKRAMY